MVLLLLLGLMDLIAGIFILISHNSFLSQIAFYIGIILLFKGAWSLFMGTRSF